MRLLFTNILLIIGFLSLAAQNVTNVMFWQEGKKVYISYELDKEADVTVSISTDGGKTFTPSLLHVTGAVGKGVSPGKKTIVWDALAEYDKIIGENICFRVSADRDRYTDNRVYDVVDQVPAFNGNINQWLASNLRYPPVAAENGIEGRVVVSFVVGKDGLIHSTQIVQSKMWIEMKKKKIVEVYDQSLEREAIRVVQLMPRWSPGKQNGQPVNCKFTLPINFRFQ